MHTYRLDDADTIVVALGSVLGTIKDTVDEMRAAGEKIGVLGITLLPAVADGRGARGARPREARRGAREEPRRGPRRHRRRPTCRTSYAGSPDDVHTVIAGLGGRAITRDSLHARVRAAPSRARLDPLTFLDLDHALVDRVLDARARAASLRADRRGASCATSASSPRRSAEGTP